MTAKILPFTPMNQTNCFTKAEFKAVRRMCTKRIARRRIAKVTWDHAEAGDVISALGTNGRAIFGLGRQDRKTHAIDHKGRCIAESARFDKVLDGVREWSRRGAL